MTSPSKPENLQANRNGQITPEQRKAVGVLSSAVISVVLLAAAVAGGGLFLIMAITLLAEGEPAGLWLGGLALVVAGASALYCLYRLAGAVLTQLDLNEGRLEQAEGQARWTGMGYAAEWPGRPRWTVGPVSGLGPGAYQFYYLPRSGRVLSAAPLPGMAQQAAQDLLSVLGKVHGFSEDDLALNRHGRMSARQKRRLAAAAVGFSLFGLVAALFGGFGVWVLFDADGGQDLLTGGLVTVMGLSLALLMAWLVGQLARDAARGSVKQVKGELRLSFRSNGKSTSYFYHLGRETFSVSPAAYGAVVKGKHYRVYYAPRSRRVLGMEIV